MALTASEEALVRNLLDQQAAILSLAASESTIISKLGATKVTLSDLVAASAVADADLLLARQGITDKSVTASILAQYLAAELGSEFVNVTGDTMSGALALFGGDTGVTPAQFDTDESLVTSAFVQRALGNFSGVTTYSGAATLTAADAGKAILSSGTHTLTLPAASAVAAGSCIHVFCNSGTTTVQRAGADTLSGLASATSVALGVGDTVTLRSNGTNSWLATAGSVQLGSSASFLVSLLANGYAKLPNGLIIQWGVTGSISQSGAATVTFPIAFPTGLLRVVASPQTGVANSNVYSVATSTGSASQFTIFNNSATSGVAIATWIAVGY